MPTYLDPTAPVPEPDAQGRLRLTETNANIAVYWLGILIALVMGIGGGLYCYQGYFNGGLPAGLDLPRLEVLAAIGLLAPVAIPFLGWLIMNPDTLTVDDSGIALRKFGQTKCVAWDQISAINTVVPKPPPFNPGGGNFYEPITNTIISSPSGNLWWKPVFGMNPEALAAYLTDRRNASVRGAEKLLYAAPAMTPTQNTVLKVERGMYFIRMIFTWCFIVVVLGFCIFLGFICAQLNGWHL